MGRVLRSRGGSENGNCENLAPKTSVQKPKVKTTGCSNKSNKSALSDRTNINLSNNINVKCDTKEIHRVTRQRRNLNVPIPIEVSHSPVSSRNKRNNRIADTCDTSKNRESTKKGMVESKNVKSKSNSQCHSVSRKKDKSLLGFEAEEDSTTDKFSVDEPFLGFKKTNKSPLLDLLKKRVNNFNTKDSSKKNHLPVYRLNKPSPPKMDTEDRLHLYDFEVDENEPVVKKGKRKPILKIKKHRTYNRKKKDFFPTLTCNKTPTSVNSSNNENMCPRRQLRNKPQNGYTPMSPIPETHHGEDILDKSIAADMDTSIESHSSNRLQVYSPPPYQSPKRDSLNVPILRTSTSMNDNTTLNKSVNSSKHDISMNSAFSANFNSPMYIGSSTPIHRHWSEQTNYICSNATPRAYETFDESNYFGFDVDSVEEPIVSPIKRHETPLKPNTPKKPSPVKIPHRQVIRMLIFGPDAPENVPDDSLPIAELPPNFFHEGVSPTFSPPSSPVTPVLLKKNRKINRAQPAKKKQVAFVEEDFEDSDFATQSSEDKTSQEDESIRSNDQTCRRITRSKQQPLSKILTGHQASRKHGNKDDSDIEIDNGYETEISPNKQNTSTNSTKQGRRSYERPVYLRQKKYGHFEVVEPDEEEVEEVVKEKPPPKKKNALSKKEEMELEKWAKAFNEQCMQVDNFNLVVE